MANSGKNSNTSQFYITLADSLPQLDGKHVVFGRIVEGSQILDRIGKALNPNDLKLLLLIKSKKRAEPILAPNSSLKLLFARLRAYVEKNPCEVAVQP